MIALSTSRLELLPVLTVDDLISIREGRSLHGHTAAPGFPHPDFLQAIPVIQAALFQNADSWWIWILVKEGRLIGDVGLQLWEDGRREVGFAMAEGYRRQGLMEEAVRAVLDHARKEGLNQVLALSHLDNTASEAFLRKLGFAAIEQRPNGTLWERRLVAAPPQT
jgi:RimJ/RimL family protein N-acetyltransferase